MLSHLSQVTYPIGVGRTAQIRTYTDLASGVPSIDRNTYDWSGIGVSYYVREVQSRRYHSSDATYVYRPLSGRASPRASAAPADLWRADCAGHSAGF